MNRKDNKPDTLTQRQTRRARHLYFASVLSVALCAALAARPSPPLVAAATRSPS